MIMKYPIMVKIPKGTNKQDILKFIFEVRKAMDDYIVKRELDIIDNYINHIEIYIIVTSYGFTSLFDIPISSNVPRYSLDDFMEMFNQQNLLRNIKDLIEDLNTLTNE